MSPQVIFFFLIVTLGGVVYGEKTTTKVAGCGGTATLNFVKIQGCKDSVDERCKFVKGKFYQIKVDITAKADAEKLPYSGTAAVLGHNITFFEGNGCDLLVHGDCPAKVDEHLVFQKKITVTNKYPDFESVMKLQFDDEKGNVLMCAEIKFAVVKSKAKTKG